MNKKIKILSGLVLVQLTLIALVFFFSPNMGVYESGKKLLSFQPQGIVKISIQSKGGGLMEMVKANSGWTMPKNFDAPVSASLVNDLLNKLTSMTKTWPAGKTMEAAREFKTVEGFERKITLSDGKKDHILFLGDSPGIKKIYARVDGENDTYPVAFALSEASINPKEWIDWDSFRAKKEDVVSINYKDMTLTRDGASFTIADLSDDEEVKKQDLDGFAGMLIGVEIDDVLGSEEKQSYQMNNPYVSWKLTLKNGETIDYVISNLQPENAHVLKISKYPQYFRISTKTTDKLKSYAKEGLIQKKEVAPPPLQANP